MDCFEWTGGYGPQFGLYSVDAQSNTLLPKASAELFRSFIVGRVMDSDIAPSKLDSATRMAISDR